MSESFIDPSSEPTYWAYRTRKAAEYLEYCKDMHQKALKRLAEVAMREEQQKELDRYNPRVEIIIDSMGDK